MARWLALLAGLSIAAASSARAMVVFGDVHAHSGLSDDGVGDPYDFFRSARDYYQLDFVVLSDHDIYLTPDEWRELNDAAAEFDEPGRFVAFPGTEWTHQWHMNFYFRDGYGEICSGGGGPDCGTAAEAHDYYAARVLANEGASHVCHPHQLTPVQWWRMRDDVATNVEIWNTHWNRSFGPDANDTWFGGPLWALKVGFKLGFVASSDDHDLYDLWNLLGSGLTACRVDELSRSAIIDALRARRCYATNGHRNLLDFDIDGTKMGQELSVPIGSTVTANVGLVAVTVPTAIEVVANGAVVATKTDCASNACTFAAPIPVREEYNFVYARVREGDKDRTWSSPVWVRGTCTSPGDCPVERFVPGMGAESARCLASLRVKPAVAHTAGGKLRRTAVCTEGDPSCDYDFGPNTCTFLVSLCVGVDPNRNASCTFAPAESLTFTTMHSDGSFFDGRNQQTLGAAAEAMLSSEAPGRCGPYVPVTVPLRQSASGALLRAARSYVLRGEFADGRRDRDRLTLICEPPASSTP